MKVALVIYGSLDTVSGGYLYDRMLVSRLRRAGDQVQIISQVRRAYAANLLDNFHAAPFPNVDVVVQDELNHPSLFMANRRSPRPPIVSIVHHLRSSEHRAAWLNGAYAEVERAYLRGVDGFIFNSNTTRDSVRALMPADRPHVVATPGGDRFGWATEEHVHARISKRQALRIVSVGSVTPGKGFDVLIDSLSGLPAESVRLDIAGSELAAPAFARRMRANAARLDVPVKFHGALDDAALQRLLQEADVFVLPSYYEGFGIVYLEAMAQGLPVIGAAAGALPAIIRDGSNGYLIPPGNAVQLSERLRVLAEDRELLLRLSLNALREARSFPTWDQSTQRMRDFLVSMVR